MGENVRVGPWLLESEGSGSTFLGHYHSGIYRDSRVNRHTNDTFSSIDGLPIESPQAHLARDRGRTANSCGSEITSTRPHNDFVPSDPPVPPELLMMRRTPRQLPATLRQPSGSSARLSRQKLPLGWYHRLCVRTERAASELDRSKWDPCLAFEFRNLGLSERRQVAGQEMQKSVFSHFGHSSTIVARARAVRMSLRATPEAQGGRHSGRTEGLRRGLSARANLRVREGVNPTWALKY